MENIYKTTEIVGSSTQSMEDAVAQGCGKGSRQRTPHALVRSVGDPRAHRGRRHRSLADHGENRLYHGMIGRIGCNIHDPGARRGSARDNTASVTGTITGEPRRDIGGLSRTPRGSQRSDPRSASGADFADGGAGGRGLVSAAGGCHRRSGTQGDPGPQPGRGDRARGHGARVAPAQSSRCSTSSFGPICSPAVRWWTWRRPPRRTGDGSLGLGNLGRTAPRTSPG